MENPGEIIFRLLSSWVNSPGIQEMLFFPKLVLMPLGIFFLLFVIFASFKSSWFYYLVLVDAKEWFTFRAFGLRRMASKWQQALSRLETVNEAEYKLAIIEADAMIDEALKRLGFGGQTMEERLQNISPLVFTNLQELKDAHRLRNNIVHDPNFLLSMDQARRAMGVYQQSLTELDLI